MEDESFEIVSCYTNMRAHTSRYQASWQLDQDRESSTNDPISLIEDLSKKLEEMIGLNMKLGKQNKDLVASNQKQIKLNERLKDRKQELEEKNQELEDMSQDLGIDNRKLKERSEKFKERIKELLNKNDKLEDKSQELEDTKQELEKKNHEIKRRYQELEGVKRELEEKKVEQEQVLQDLTEEVYRLNTEVSERRNESQLEETGDDARGPNANTSRAEPGNYELTELVPGDGGTQASLHSDKAEIQQLKRFIKHLEEELAKETSEVGRLKDEITNLRNNQISERKLAQKDEEIARLESELRSRRSGPRHSEDELTQKNARLGGEQRSRRGSPRHSDDELARKIKEIEELKNDLEDLEVELKVKDDKAKKNETRLKQKHERTVKKLENEVEDLRQELADLEDEKNKEIDILREKNKRRMREAPLRSQQASELDGRRELTTMKEKIETLTSENAKLKRENQRKSGRNEEVTQLKKLIDAANEREKSLQKQIETVNEQKDKEIVDLKDQIDALYRREKDIFRRSSEREQKLIEQKAALETEIQALTSQNDKLKKETQETVGKDEEMELLKSRIVNFTKREKDYQRTVNRLTEQQKENGKKLRQTKMEMEDQRMKIEELEVQSNEKNKAVIEELRLQLSKKEEDLQRMRKSGRDLQKQLEESNKVASGNAKRCAQLMENNDKMTYELNEGFEFIQKLQKIIGEEGSVSYSSEGEDCTAKLEKSVRRMIVTTKEEKRYIELLKKEVKYKRSNQKTRELTTLQQALEEAEEKHRVTEASYQQVLDRCRALNDFVIFLQDRLEDVTKPDFHGRVQPLPLYNKSDFTMGKKMPDNS